jgi:hypothetical protein
MSAPPPGGNPFTNMIGWVGQLCAIAGMLLTNSAARTMLPFRQILILFLPCRMPTICVS